jgi:uncharacterized protein YjbI with pentapeptide repeats
VANEEHLALLKKGVEAWNAWRPESRIRPVPDLSHGNLSGANLSEVDLSATNLLGADLSATNLFGADLRSTNLFGADLSGANLVRAMVSKADLSAANLTSANLSGARLPGANLTHANLTRTSLVSADLSGADLSGAILRGTFLPRANLAAAKLTDAYISEAVFGDVDLSTTLGLDSCNHLGPSTIDHRTLLKSGPLPLLFLRGCGLPDRLINYLPSLLETRPIQFYSCFISYSTSNQDFANRLYADLQSEGVRCWFALHHMRPGGKIDEQIDAAIRLYDRLLLILSAESMSSPWVKTEIGKARHKELAEKRRVLFPLALVPFNDIRKWEQFNADLGEDTAKEIREFFLPDFSDWKNHDAYQQWFAKVLNALKSAN